MKKKLNVCVMKDGMQFREDFELGEISVEEYEKIHETHCRNFYKFSYDEKRNMGEMIKIWEIYEPSDEELPILYAKGLWGSI